MDFFQDHLIIEELSLSLFCSTLLTFPVITLLAQSSLSSRIVHVSEGPVSDRFWLGEGFSFPHTKHFC